MFPRGNTFPRGNMYNIKCMKHDQLRTGRCWDQIIMTHGEGWVTRDHLNINMHHNTMPWCGVQFCYQYPQSSIMCWVILDTYPPTLTSMSTCFMFKMSEYMMCITKKTLHVWYSRGFPLKSHSYSNKANHYMTLMHTQVAYSRMVHQHPVTWSIEMYSPVQQWMCRYAWGVHKPQHGGCLPPLSATCTSWLADGTPQSGDTLSPAHLLLNQFEHLNGQGPMLLCAKLMSFFFATMKFSRHFLFACAARANLND